MRNSILLLLVALLVFPLTDANAQRDSKNKNKEVSDSNAENENLVKNGNFEETTTRTLKNPGGLEEFCEGWFAATKAPADIFARGVKSEKVSVPDNAYGSQDALSGDCYAGFRAYTKDKKTNRTYLETAFRTPMEKDQMYCVKFNVSLSDLSKYSVNSIGAYIVSKRTKQPNTGEMVKDFQIKHPTNKTINEMDGWETICGTYLAKGGETHIVLGCFERDDKLSPTKMKRPRGFTSTQKYDAYYYVDDVEVSRIQAKSQCGCNRGENRGPEVIYSKSVVVTDDMSPREVISKYAVYYGYLRADPNAVAKRDLKKVIDILNANPGMKLHVVGHCDNDEYKEGLANPRYAEIAKKRANAVVEYLKDQGISELRVVPKSKDNTAPANNRPTPLSVAENRRVTFEVR